MSKKTIRFKMPATNSPGRDDGPGDAAAQPQELSLSVSPRKAGATEVASALEPDWWVQNRDRTSALELAPVAVASPALRPSAMPSLMIDLAGERNFAEAVALSFLLPSLLGWFWGANAIIRTWGNIGVTWRAQISIAASGAARDA